MGMKDSHKGNGTSTFLSKAFGNKGNHQKEPEKLEVDISEKSENGVVTSFAEKAMSVAGPMVPMKEDGEVDHERFVSCFCIPSDLATHHMSLLLRTSFF